MPNSEVYAHSDLLDRVFLRCGAPKSSPVAKLEDVTEGYGGFSRSKHRLLFPPILTVRFTFYMV